MQPAQPCARRDDRVIKRIFFDIHVERIQQQLHVRKADLFAESNPFRSRIQQVPLEPVQTFQTIINAAVRRNLPNIANVPDPDFPVALFIDRLRVIDRPIAVQPAADRPDSEILTLW